MNRDELRLLLNRRPFSPLRIKTSGGEVFEVRHPEMAMLGKNTMHIVLCDEKGKPKPGFGVVAYLQIANVQVEGELAA